MKSFILASLFVLGCATNSYAESIKLCAYDPGSKSMVHTLNAELSYLNGEKVLSLFGFGTQTAPVAIVRSFAADSSVLYACGVGGLEFNHAQVFQNGVSVAAATSCILPSSGLPSVLTIHFEITKSLSLYRC